jgi:hypothetical protein
MTLLPDSLLIARRLCGMPRYLVGSPNYRKQRGRPRHLLDLAEHACITYGHAAAPDS